MRAGGMGDTNSRGKRQRKANRNKQRKVNQPVAAVQEPVLASVETYVHLFLSLNFVMV